MNMTAPTAAIRAFANQTPAQAGTIPRIANAIPASITPQYTRNNTIANENPMNFSLRCVVIARGIPARTNTRLENASAIFLWSST